MAKSVAWVERERIMVDFSQKSASITTFHILHDDPKHLRNQIRLHSRWKKTVLVIPLLASEYTDPANLPVFENILKQLRDVNYLSTIIFGLDRATEAEAFRLRDLIQRLRNPPLPDPVERRAGFHRRFTIS